MVWKFGRVKEPVLAKADAGHALSVNDRGQKCSRGFVVKAYAHQCHGLDDTQSSIQAPLKQPGIAARHQEARPGNGCCRSDQGLQIIIGFTDCMSEEANRSRISCNTTITVNHACSFV